ncbi:MAG: patatin-like phospholipase family protein [Betaproteobacteria bacterium]|nr:patatin-like phospholipase family protein [Betaproteobacteria bacterium]
MDAAPARQHYPDELLSQHLRRILPDVEPPVLESLRQRVEWVEVAGGQTLMAQGEPGDSMYLAISGRLRAYVRAADGSERMAREMGRGHTIGEMSLFTGEPRAATVVAIRDSVLVRLPKPEFDRILASSAQLSIALTRQIIGHLRDAKPRSDLARPVMIGIVPVTARVDPRAFAEQLAGHLRRHGRVRVLDAATVDRELREEGLAQREHGDAQADRRVALLLEEIEAGHDFVLLVGDDRPTPWTQRCSRHCDELLLLADAGEPPALHAIETQCLDRRPQRAEAAEILVLLHREDAGSPRGTRAWLDRRAVSHHVHVRPALARDMARLARILSRNAVGLVFAGGGARGFAHLGVHRALAEHGIDVDYVGGTSIGATMAACVAFDRPLEFVLTHARRAFGANPTGDFNFIPLLSLIKGRRLQKVLRTAVHDFAGFDANVEDLWKNFFCVATNYSQARQHVIRRGDLARALRSSVAIPGALPPVIADGDLLCDGGTFNNFPVDVMQQMHGVGRVIGVDLDFRKPRRIEFDEVPDGWTLLRDRLRPRGRRRYRLPSLMSYLMNMTILYSMSRQHDARRMTDLYFNPPLERVGMLEWSRFDEIVELGYVHGLEVLRRQHDAAGALGAAQ